MGDKERRLHCVENLMCDVWDLLHTYLPLANAHTTDFIATKQWEQFLPSPVRDQLLALTPAELAQLPSGRLWSSEKLSVEHFSSVMSHNQPQKHARQNIDTSTKSMERRKLPRNKCPKWTHSELKDFVMSVICHSLPGLRILTDLTSLMSVWRIDRDDQLVVSNIMSAKKSHEVKVMAQVCADIAQYTHVRQVVDIGSGKGYLSSHLALMHNLPVLGIDSSEINTGSAAERTQRLTKHWNGLLRNAKEEHERGFKVKRGKNYRGKLRKKEAKEKPETAVALDKAEENQSDDVEDLDISVDSLFTASDLTNLETCKSGNKQIDILEINKSGKSESQVTLKSSSNNQRHATDIDKCSCPTLSQSLKNADSRNIENIKVNNQQPHKNVNHSSQTSLYVPVTQYVTSETDLKELIETHMENVISCGEGSEGGVMLTGLHTCGNLASSVLKLYVSNSCVTSLCNVGCCYNHLDEAFVKGPFEQDGEVPAEFGFPMSQFLYLHGCQLGRNARMLASQSPDRMAQENKVSQKALFWRAVLQVLLCDLTGQDCDDWHVGRIAGKCTTFLQYVHKALAKLNIPNELSDEEIQSYEKRYQEEEAKLTAFFQLRATLGPCVEALILLDRLAYLLEQDSVENAYLVQLFEPVTSPRCYGIISVKENLEQ